MALSVPSPAAMSPQGARGAPWAEATVTGGARADSCSAVRSGVSALPVVACRPWRKAPEISKGPVLSPVAMLTCLGAWWWAGVTGEAPPGLRPAHLCPPSATGLYSSQLEGRDKGAVSTLSICFTKVSTYMTLVTCPSLRRWMAG